MSAAANEIAYIAGMPSPAMSIDELLYGACSACVSPDQISTKTFWAMIASPNVVSSAGSGPLSASGSSRSRWTGAARRNSAGATSTIVTSGSIPVCWVSSRARYAPSTTSSPWTRLISFITPNTSDRPSAVMANSPPSSAPETSAVRNSCPVGIVTCLCARRARHREQEVAGLDFLGRADDDRLAALPLVLDELQLGGVLGVELDRSRDVRLVRLGDRRVDLLLVGRPRRLEGVEQHLRRGRRVGDVLRLRLAGLLLELRAELLGPGVRQRRVPVAADEHAVGELAERLRVLDRLATLLDHKHLRREAGGGHLLAHRDRRRGDRGDEPEGGLLWLRRLDDRAELRRVDRERAVLHDGVAELLGHRRPQLAADDRAVRAVVGEDRDALVRLVVQPLVLQRPERQGGELGLVEEQVPGVVPLRLDRLERLERVAAGDERHALAVGDERARVDERRRARAEHCVDLVARDEAGRVVGGRVRVGLVVEQDQLDLLLLAVDGDAAGGVDLVDRVLVAPLHERPEAGQRAAQRDGRADLDGAAAAVAAARTARAAAGREREHRRSTDHGGDGRLASHHVP